MSLKNALRPAPANWKPQPMPGHGTAIAYVPPNLAPIDPIIGPNPFIRCPLPPINTPSPDSLAQFYRNGVATQRIFGIK